MYIYISHYDKEGLYISDTELTEEDLECELCCDTDLFVGVANNKDETINVLNEFFAQMRKREGDEVVDKMINDFLDKYNITN